MEYRFVEYQTAKYGEDDPTKHRELVEGLTFKEAREFVKALKYPVNAPYPARWKLEHVATWPSSLPASVPRERLKVLASEGRIKLVAGRYYRTCRVYMIWRAVTPSKPRGISALNKSRMVCKAGHDISPESGNVRVRADGSRVCKICSLERSRRSKQRARLKKEAALKAQTEMHAARTDTRPLSNYALDRRHSG